MDEAILAQLAKIRSRDAAEQGEAYRALIAMTETSVDWAYEAWDDLLAALRHEDNRTRSIAAQLLCNLAKSDPEGRMLRDFEALLGVTRDERFVTARHCLLALWKVAAAGPAQKSMVVDGMAVRFADCAAEKNRTLIRYDIQEGLRKIHELDGDEAVRARALVLIEAEEDAKYRKKYSSVWRAK